MNRQSMWKNFEKTGLVSVYLKYKQEENGTYPLGESLEYKDKRNCDREKNVRGAGSDTHSFDG